MIILIGAKFYEKVYPRENEVKVIKRVILQR